MQHPLTRHPRDSTASLLNFVSSTGVFETFAKFLNTLFCVPQLLVWPTPLIFQHTFYIALADFSLIWCRMLDLELKSKYSSALGKPRSQLRDRISPAWFSLISAAIHSRNERNLRGECHLNVVFLDLARIQRDGRELLQHYLF